MLVFNRQHISCNKKIMRFKIVFTCADRLSMWKRMPVLDEESQSFAFASLVPLVHAK